MPRRFLPKGLMILAVIGISVHLLAFVSSTEPFISANDIDVYLAQKSSPLAGLGSVFVEEGIRFDIDPRLVVAIAGAETTFGTNMGCNAPFNAWSWFWNNPNDCPKNHLDSWEDGIRFVTRQISLYRTRLLQEGTAFTIQNIGLIYCAEGCEHWEPNVTKFYRDELGGNTSDLGFSEIPPPPGPQPGPDVGDFVHLPMLVQPGALALMNGDVQALVADVHKLSILDLASREVETAVEGLTLPIGIAIEGQGPTALVLDYGNPQFTGDPVGQLLRVNFETDAKNVLASGFVQPFGLAIELGGRSALVRDAHGIHRVNFSPQNVSLLASGIGSGGIAIEPGGTSALLPIVLTSEIKRINLQTNELSTVPRQLPGVIRGGAVAVAPDGSFALVAAGGGDAGIAKVDLRTGETIQVFAAGLASFGSHRMGDFRLTANAAEAIFTWFSADHIGNRISRLHLSDQAVSDVTYGITPLALALDDDGSTVLVTSRGSFGALYSLDIASGAPEFISGAGIIPTDLAILPGGNSALITAERFFVPTGDLFQVDFATGQTTSIAITPAPQGVVAEAFGITALITTGETLSRVLLSTGQVSAIASGLVSPAGLALESSGQVAIVGSLSNEVVRVLLTELVPPTVEHITTLTNSARYVAVESGNKTVLVAETGRGLSRIDVATETVTELFADPTVSGKVVIERGGSTALLATQEGIKRVRIR